MIRVGIDYLAPLPVSEVSALGASFVVRYTSTLTASEAQELSAAGIDIVLVHETSPDAITGGELAGEQAAQAALEAATTVGMKGGRPIYFAPADLDVSGNPSVMGPYFDGVARVLPLSRIGGYQGYDAIGWLFDQRKITWAWQTAAWSQGRWDPRAQIRQTGFSHAFTIPGWDNDLAVADDFGQWAYGVLPPPPGPTVKIHGKPVSVGALLPPELREARAYARYADVHPHWHPHHTADALRALVKARKTVWRAAEKGIGPDGKPTTPGWDHEQRRERYHELSVLTDWPVKAAA